VDSIARLRPLALVLALGAVSGCGQDTPVAAPSPTVTVTATVTVTETVAPHRTPPVPAAPPSPSPSVLPRIGLVVHTDGCGLIREDVDETRYRNLGWSISDEDGFEVLQRNALGELRYRYFQPGIFTAALTAFDGQKYVSVSDEVTITC